MSEYEEFQQRFGTLDVTMRAALVFRYREGLPLSHVAQLVDRPVTKLGPALDRMLVALRDASVLPPMLEPEKALAEALDELRADPELSSFSLVRGVRAEQNRRGAWRRRRFA